MLKTLVETNSSAPLGSLWAKKAVYLDLQKQLSRIGLLDPEFTGSATQVFGPAAQHINRQSLPMLGMGLSALLPGFDYNTDLITPDVAQSLLEAKLGAISVEVLPEDDDKTKFCKTVVAYMLAKGMYISQLPGTYNVVYIEGADPDGKLNPDAPDLWNDVRMAFSIEQGTPKVHLSVRATTEPGKLYSKSNTAQRVGGAARIAFGQYKAWMRGYHKVSSYGQNHPALVQRGLIRAHRDLNADMIRTGDKVVVGAAFGINQHSTKEGYFGTQVDTWSAGCLVGWNWGEHQLFLDITGEDARYKLDKNYLYTTAVVPGDGL